jgi:hypothetical protein
MTPDDSPAVLHVDCESNAPTQTMVYTLYNSAAYGMYPGNRISIVFCMMFKKSLQIVVLLFCCTLRKRAKDDH